MTSRPLRAGILGAMPLDVDDRLTLDYEQTTQYLRTLIDVRFRLLAFVPTVAGIAVAVIGRPRPAAELLGVGVLGLLATLGIFVYELRNTQISGTLIRRAAELERQLAAPVVARVARLRRPLHGAPRDHAFSCSASFPSRTGSGSRSSTRRRSPAGATSSPGERFGRRRRAVGSGRGRGARRGRGRDRPLRGRAVPPPCGLARGAHGLGGRNSRRIVGSALRHDLLTGTKELS